jgi:hypothetical protein
LGRQLGGGEISCWICWERFEGTDGRLFCRQLGGGEISCLVCLVSFEGTDGRLFVRQLGGEDISCFVCWVRLDVTDCGCLVWSWVWESYRAVCDGSDLKGWTAYSLLGNWLGESFRGG